MNSNSEGEYSDRRDEEVLVSRTTKKRERYDHMSDVMKKIRVK